MLLSSGLVFVGLVLLVVGGEVLLRGAVALSIRLKLTPAIIGLTVVAAGTSVPELAVSLIAAASGRPDISMGNVVGSNICNSTLILGLAALITPLMVAGNMIKLEYPVMALVTLMCLAVAQDQNINRIDGALFILTYAGFIAYVVGLVRAQVSKSEVSDLEHAVGELKTKEASLLVSLALIVGGIIILGAGAQATVEGAVRLARLWGMTERVIGLTIVAVGTALPEIVTSIISGIRGRADMAIGNIIGSNLFNILIILGVTALVSPITVSESIAHSDMWWMLGTSAVLFPFMYTGLRINRAEGGLLLGLYGVFLWMLVGS